jgi:DNA polymerase III subunit delta'
MSSLADIQGQPRAVGQLTRYLTSDRRHHAMLFIGPEGVGRRTTAEALAQSLLCPNAGAPDIGPLVAVEAPPGPPAPCGECEDCRLFLAGSHPDYHPIYKELARYHSDSQVRSRVMQDLGIPVIRQFLLAPVGQSPTRNRGKVFVVREAQLMSIAAQNAMLKTLEEPPAGVTIILLALRPELMLPTTVSRCATVRFGPLPAEIIAERLITDGVDPDQANFWARFTEGSLGRAIKLATGELYELKQTILPALANISAGGDGDLAEKLAKMADNLADQAVAETKQADGAALSKTLATRQAAGTMLKLIASLYCDAMHVASGADTPLVHSDQPDCVQRVAERFEPSQLAGLLGQLSRFEQILWQNVNPKLVWDNVVIACGAPTDTDF